MSTAEIYASEKLQCDTADLVILDDVYSKLAESAFRANRTSLDKVLEDNTTLQDLLYVTYSKISRAVDKVLKEKIEAVGDQEGLGTYIKEQLDNFESREPFINYLNTSFDSDLDDIVDWDKDVEDNAQMLLNKWVENYFNDKEYSHVKVLRNPKKNI